MTGVRGKSRISGNEISNTPIKKTNNEVQSDGHSEPKRKASSQKSSENKKMPQKNGGKEQRRKSPERDESIANSEDEMQSAHSNVVDDDDAPLSNKKKSTVEVPADNEEYEVSAILDHKIENGTSLFLVRWKGYTKDDDTWENEKALSCRDLIEKYQRKKTKAQQNGSTDNKANKSNMPMKKRKINEKKDDPNKEWEVEKIIDYAEEKMGRLFRIRWKGYGSRYDTWEPEAHLNCEKIIQKFMARMKAQENVTFKELREEPKKTKRLLNETVPRSTYSLAERKSKRSALKKRVYYGDSD